ncbi:microcin C ABC transporter permease YejB [Helicobacter mustelae]|uniref:Putative ABC transporter integral membrane subunit n=1 Tax=Helicobacter mustelae (strain ATCC 43772 / CCUG 25715 / CIP 103759 / LMG 18044 / NCTC 12198 / R85-136P) TaxID=679897 RepID=D3UIB4_HELM1|nr:microcin C ABC transporter permease YejB [Helicobacter mustelae]CBG40237.1 putative ABC transporter integral membrane subunit [Helicobacter mustelae 12198]SQH71736.1 ABC transporter integral membrane subunit [Helicobacter mustelae]STP12865.1 ABC transporter integral membrane subunit [Helicobacter mustelae]
MYAYILKRLMLMIPTLLGIITINFFIIQLAPGGPVEQMMQKIDALQSVGGEVFKGSAKVGAYRGDSGMDQEMIAQLKKIYGFDKPIWERYFLMLKQYLKLDFGQSYYRQISVLDLIKEKLPVSISLGVFSTLIIYLLGIPLGIFKAYRDGGKWDVISSVVIIMANAIPVFLFGILLIVFFAGGSYFDWFPLKGLVGDDFENLSFWGKIRDYLWHITLPVLCLSIGGFATLVLLVKNSFLDEMQKYYVMYGRIKGVGEQALLYKHIFRNAMLLVISSFPAVFLGMFFSGSLLIEIIFSLDGLGLLGYDSLLHRDYPVVFGTLYIFTLLGLLASLVSDLLYVVVDPRIHFEKN